MPTKFNWWKRLLLIFSIIMVPKLIPKTFSISWNKNSNVAAFMSNWKSAVHQSEQSQLRYIFYFFCMKTNCMIKILWYFSAIAHIFDWKERCGIHLHWARNSGHIKEANTVPIDRIYCWFDKWTILFRETKGNI